MGVDHDERGVLPGGNGRRVHFGVASFTGTAATVEVPTHLKRIEAASLTFLGAPVGDDGVLSLNETVSDGRVQVPATGQVTITRLAGAAPTADLAVSFWFVGY